MQPAIRAFLFALVMASTLASCQRAPPYQPTGLVTSLDSDFEDDRLTLELVDGSGRHESAWDLEGCCDHSITTVASPGKAGRAVRFELRCEDEPVSNGRRAEFKKRLGSLIGRTQSYSFSTYLPEGWSAGQSAEPVYVSQWHELPDTDLGETWRVSPLALQLRDGHWAIAVNHDARAISDPAEVAKTLRSYTLEPFRGDVGRWVSWTFRVHWSVDGTGSLAVWKDGRQVLDLAGPIGYNDRNGPYFKAGAYRSHSSECPMTVLMDDFSFRDETP